MLDEVRASSVRETSALIVVPVRTRDPHLFVESLAATGPDTAWATLVSADVVDGDHVVFAVPVSSRFPKPSGATFLEIHSRLVAWWLVYQWRTRELAEALGSVADLGLPIATAACVRPLVETAAAFWSDCRRTAAQWDEMKRFGTPRHRIEDWVNFRELLDEVDYGGKFKDGDLEREYGLQNRTNVIGHVEKLARAAGGEVMADYQ